MCDRAIWGSWQTGPSRVLASAGCGQGHPRDAGFFVLIRVFGGQG